jgi:hypothetical protein
MAWRRLDPTFRHQLSQRRQDGVAMDVKAQRESATAGKAIAGAQPPAPDVSRQRASYPQKRRKSAVSIEIDYEFPGSLHCLFRKSADSGLYRSPQPSGLIEIRIAAHLTWTSLK